MKASINIFSMPSPLLARRRISGLADERLLNIQDEAGRVLQEDQPPKITDENSQTVLDEAGNRISNS